MIQSFDPEMSHWFFDLKSKGFGLHSKHQEEKVSPSQNVNTTRLSQDSQVKITKNKTGSQTSDKTTVSQSTDKATASKINSESKHGQHNSESKHW